MRLKTFSYRVMPLVISAGLAAAPIAALANANDMISGGCTTKHNCAAAMGGSSFANVYAAHGFSSSSFVSSDTVMGSVTNGGSVIVNGSVVATGAQSFGRQNLPGSTKVGSGLFRRPTSVSFRQKSLSAWVHMQNGQFKFAVITSCGNLAVAKPVAAPRAHKVVRPQTVAAPAPTVNVVQQQSQVQTQTPAPAPAPAPVQQEALPQTGSTAAGLAGLTTLLVAGWYYLRSRSRLRLSLRRG